VVTPFSRVLDFHLKVAASSVSLKEKVEALTISYQTVTQANSEMDWRLKEVTQQNEYLRKQLGNSLKQKQQILDSPSGLVPDEVNEEAES